ncbi:MAG: hypothetical protein A2860_00660 [Candidatus Levybacteria bacterium RIFCSPHIGHO2_01_FULL_37_33]|nr:MAG: hypothetical protein A2860_00660 [Candidatus Levybacteria bacterium RIFCSPHIGHO2_01_FULL_37_33]OGH30086.1 MAG: hypothetical protein A3F30_03880 [Candidatus Levybacteria bacterium RIFCSPHIGHO2_12_FULL_37_12]OGH32411.1 MAG: hypothetical protein A2953_03160 [Candidatus Levybacteria bacterium RIFCSPLOWO2_01_FULL_36_54]
MKKKLLILIGIFVLAVTSYKVTFALFSSQATSTNNTFAAAEVFPPQTDHIVISEVQIKGSGTESNKKDFIELYNPTSSPKNLAGHRLVKRATPSTTDNNVFVFNSSHIIPAHGYFLWANSENGFSASILADISSTDNISTNDSIALRNGPVNTGTIVDAIAWGSTHASPLVEGSSFSTNPNNADESLERKALSTSDATSMSSGADVSKGNGFDSNNNSTDFILRTTSQPQNSSSPAETP